MATKDNKPNESTPKAEEKGRPSLPKELQAQVDSGDLVLVREDTYKDVEAGAKGNTTVSDVHAEAYEPKVHNFVRLVSQDPARSKVKYEGDDTEYGHGSEVSESFFNDVLANEKDRNGNFLFKAEEV